MKLSSVRSPVEAVPVDTPAVLLRTEWDLGHLASLSCVGDCRGEKLWEMTGTPSHRVREAGEQETGTP